MNALRYKVLPQINDYSRTNYRQETTIIDLRWGIDATTDDERIGVICEKYIRKFKIAIAYCV